ncbi:MAG: DUF389 domain-containing protein, partial [Lentisphaeraceae bacterium]|nr:DUF389 domain-containing protein [Lentisphaeraceae bacterium]
GVAIAAALVPPIASTGIALSHGDVSTAQGAAVLFLTNVVCIILGSALTFFAAGIRPKKSTTKKDWVQRALIGLVLGLTLLMIPLSSKLTALITSKISTSKLLSYSEIKEHSMPILEKFGIIEIDKKVTYSESNDGTLNITLNVLSSKIPEKQTVLSLEERLKEKFKREINIRLITMLIVE